MILVLNPGTSIRENFANENNTMNTDFHKIMYKYADKQQELCNQICDLNARLQTKQDECLLLKDKSNKELEALRDELTHSQEVNEGYEQDIEELDAKHTEAQTQIEVMQNKMSRQRKNIYMILYICIFCYTLFLLHVCMILDIDLHHSYMNVYDTSSRFILDGFNKTEL